MRILSKKLVVHKTYQETFMSILDCGCSFTEGSFDEGHFNVRCIKRYNGGVITHIPVRGYVVQRNSSVDVVLNVHANFLFFAGILLLMVGKIGLLKCLFSPSLSCIPFVGIIGMGILSILLFYSDAKYVLKKIERRLLN